MPEGNENNEDKTEDPTSQRREDFRKRGDVFQSKELNSILILGAACLAFYIAGAFIIDNITQLMKEIFANIATFELTPQNVNNLLIKCLKIMGICLFPVFIAVAVAGFGGSLTQVGFLFSTESLKFDLDKINPINGFMRIFKIKTLVDVLKAVIKLTIITVVAYIFIKQQIKEAPNLVELDAMALLNYTGHAILKLVFQLGIMLIAIAIADFAWERFSYEKRLKMTKQELKEELKRSEGDPMVKSRIRSIQRSIATKRMMENVPTAQAIITNPTHIAVAIAYDREEMPSPKVVAMGAGFIAEKIKDLAKQHGVPIVVNKPLAQAMFKKMKIGQFIPRELFEATAQVLAYIYKLKGGFKKK